LFVKDYAEQVAKRLDEYDSAKDSNLVVDNGGVSDEPMFALFKAGQSRRIWNELYKVIDSSDVIIQVLDARNPDGTRCKQVEQFIKKEKKHKHLIFVLNKCDLVPTWVTVS
jgi:nuclear GTP-binding protein